MAAFVAGKVADGAGFKVGVITTCVTTPGRAWQAVDMIITNRRNGAIRAVFWFMISPSRVEVYEKRLIISY
jgi:hypothetical protein